MPDKIYRNSDQGRYYNGCLPHVRIDPFEGVLKITPAEIFSSYFFGGDISLVASSQAAFNVGMSILPNRSLILALSMLRI